MTKGINDMSAVTNTSTPSLGEEGTKTIGDLKRQRVLMEEENIKLFNEEENNLRRFPKCLPKILRFVGCVLNKNLLI